AALSHRLILMALARVEAGLAAPFQYIEIVSATLLGWLVFGDFPDALTRAGTAIIVCAGLYVFHRESRMPAPGKTS
ncbi:MAG: DMT family transporter, partial [Pseudomonadota bacterium]